MSVPMISYDTEDEYRNDNKSPRLPILTALILIDAHEQWFDSRVVMLADRHQTAAVVVSKGRARTGQAVHRRLLQQNFVAVPDVTGFSSSTLLVH